MCVVIPSKKKHLQKKKDGLDVKSCGMTNEERHQPYFSEQHLDQRSQAAGKSSILNFFLFFLTLFYERNFQTLELDAESRDELDQSPAGKIISLSNIQSVKFL